MVDTHVEAPSPINFRGLAVRACLPFEFLDEFLGDYQGSDFVSLLHRPLLGDPDFCALRARGPTSVRQTLDSLNELHLPGSFRGKSDRMRRIVQCDFQKRRTNIGGPAFLDNSREACSDEHLLRLFLRFGLPSVLPTPNYNLKFGFSVLRGARTIGPRPLEKEG